jgi:hypothetical protein
MPKTKRVLKKSNRTTRKKMGIRTKRGTGKVVHAPRRASPASAQSSAVRSTPATSSKKTARRK